MSNDFLPAPQPRPTLQTARCLLRPFFPEDAGDVFRLVNDREIAANTRSIDFPYSIENAQLWLATHEETWQQGRAAVFAICWEHTGELIGAIGLEICTENHWAEIGYWVAREHWGKGVASEAVQRVIRFGFEDLGLNRIVGHHMTRNPASGRVMDKAGMSREGTLRQHFRKWGKFHDGIIFGILAEEYFALANSTNLSSLNEGS